MQHHLNKLQSWAQSRLGRRYIALAVFFLVTFALWQHIDDALHPNRVQRRPPVTNGYRYKPSSFDWNKAKIYYPLDNIKSPPMGTPRHFPRIQSNGPGDLDEATVAKRDAIRNAFIKSWTAYCKYAWGADELAPVTLRRKNTLSGWGVQLIDALDTLWIMDLKDEFRKAVQEIARVDWADTYDRINMFEVNIRYLGGLLSAYDLSGEQVLLYKAIELGDTLYKAFDTPNHMPVRWLDLSLAKSGRLSADTRISGAAGGTLCLEFTRLSQVSGDPKYYDATERIKQFLLRSQNETSIPGLWPHDLNFQDQSIENGLYTLGAGADSLYEYLPKMHALLGGLDLEYEKMFVKALEVARDKILFKPMNLEDENLILAGKTIVNKNGATELTGEMEHLACFAGGMYALAGRLIDSVHFVDLGKRITNGCIWAYDAFETNIMPEIIEVFACDKRTEPCPWEPIRLPSGRAKNLPESLTRIRDTTYLLRPEAIESVFYMWRITGDQKYRDAAWRMWEGIVRETETEHAFATVNDVRIKGSPKADSMETFWMGETLKYFYLIFEKHDVVSLDDWVFNTEAHPFKRPGR